MKNYKKTRKNKINEIKIEAKKIPTKLGIEGRVKQFNEWNAYKKVEDQKGNFRKATIYINKLIKILNQEN